MSIPDAADQAIARIEKAARDEGPEERARTGSTVLARIVQVLGWLSVLVVPFFGGLAGFGIALGGALVLHLVMEGCIAAFEAARIRR